MLKDDVEIAAASQTVDGLLRLLVIGTLAGGIVSIARSQREVADHLIGVKLSVAV